MEPFVEGYEAYWIDIGLLDNPYPAGSNDHDDWERGWQEGADEEDWGP